MPDAIFPSPRVLSGLVITLETRLAHLRVTHCFGRFPKNWGSIEAFRLLTEWPPGTQGFNPGPSPGFSSCLARTSTQSSYGRGRGIFSRKIYILDPWVKLSLAVTEASWHQIARYPEAGETVGIVGLNSEVRGRGPPVDMICSGASASVGHRNLPASLPVSIS